MEGVSIELHNGYILITAKGLCDNFDYIIQGTQLLNDTALSNGVKRVLLDYRKIHFNLPMADAFNLVKVYEKDFPDLSSIVICVVCNRQSLELTKFWEFISAKRGYSSKVFTDFEKGKEWILSDAEQNITSY